MNSSIFSLANIGQELEESLGQIERVTHFIKITRSYPLLSFHFFKSLETIHGAQLVSDQWVLFLPGFSSEVKDKLVHALSEKGNILLRDQYHGFRLQCIRSPVSCEVVGTIYSQHGRRVDSHFFHAGSVRFPFIILMPAIVYLEYPFVGHKTPVN